MRVDVFEERPADAPAAGAFSDTDADRLTAKVEARLAELEQLSTQEMHRAWRRAWRKQPPTHLPRSLFLRLFAYRIQADAFGDLDKETMRMLERIARQRAAGEKPIVPAVPNPRHGRLKPGSLLVREHAGVLHRVTVMKEGFAWNGETYRSLSEVARRITGTSWNGPRFFGLGGRVKAEEDDEGSQAARPRRRAAR